MSFVMNFNKHLILSGKSVNQVIQLMDEIKSKRGWGTDPIINARLVFGLTESEVFCKKSSDLRTGCC
jgi:hypothetical protein